MMEHLLRILKAEHPKIESAFFRQDNAGCYYSSITVLVCHALEATGVKIKGLDFSDPQGGKGAADRLAATAKSHIRYYANEVACSKLFRPASHSNLSPGERAKQSKSVGQRAIVS